MSADNKITIKHAIIAITVCATILGGFVLTNHQIWHLSAHTHILIEAAATLFAFAAGLFSLVSYYLRSDNRLLLIGIALIGAACLDGYLLLSVSSPLQIIHTSSRELLLPWGWFASRLFMAVMLFTSWLVWFAEHKRIHSCKITANIAYMLVIIICLQILLSLVHIQLPDSYYPAEVISRPYELAAALLFAVTLFLYLKKALWKSEQYEFWLLVALIISCSSELGLAFFSRHLFDTGYWLAHIFKAISYLCLLLGTTRHLCIIIKQTGFTKATIQNKHGTEARAPVYRILYSITYKLSGFIASMVILSILTVGVWTYYIFNQSLTQEALKSLSLTATQISNNLKHRISILKEDLQFLASTPPIQGYIRAAQNTGIDPLDGSTSKQWRTRLETIYYHFLQTHPELFQIKYMGHHEQGREIVRVQRNPANGQIDIIAGPALQSRGKRKYYQKTRSLPAGSIYLSNIRFMHEFAKLTDLRIAALHIAIPIYAGKNPFGIVVISIDMGKLLQPMLLPHHNDKHVYVIDEHNDYIYHPDATRTRNIEENHLSLFDHDYPQLATLLKQHKHGQNNSVLQTDTGESGFAAGYTKNHYSGREQQYLGFIVTQDIKKVLAISRNSQQKTIFIILLILPVILLLGFFLARNFSRPILQVIRSVQAFARGEQSDIQIRSNDEIGILAKAFRDMREQILQNTQQLEFSEIKQRTVLETMVDAVITIDHNGCITSFNNAAQQIFGYSVEEVLGQNVNILVPHPFHGLHDMYIANYIRTGEKKIIGSVRELEALRKDNSTFPIELSITEMRIGDQQYFNGVIRDISKRKQAEKEIMAREASLIRSNKELEKFAYIASHDLQEPLRKIQTFGDRLQHKFAQVLDESALDYLQRIHNAASRMRTLINDLLNFSRISTHGQPFEPVALDKILQEVLGDLEIRIDDTRAKIHAATLPLIDADPVQMRQLLQNLLSNALKFIAPERQPEINISCQILHDELDTQGQHCDMLEITVRDNGIGFDERYRDRIFEVFQRLHTRNEYEGTGVGLAIVRRIAERHGGRIRAYSKPGHGSGFVVQLRTRHEFVKL